MIDKTRNFLYDQVPFSVILLDPEKVFENKNVADVISQLQILDSDVIFIGGSSNLSLDSIEMVFQKVKEKLDIPVLSFLRDASEINSHADATLAPMVINSRKSWFVHDNFLNCIDNATERGIEVLTLAYLVQPGNTSVSFLTDPQPIFQKTIVIRRYANFINKMSFDFAYLEGGSGANKTIDLKLISNFKEKLRCPLIVGGGINDVEIAEEVLKSGADGLVMGTLFERGEMVKLKEIISLVKKRKK